MDAVHAAPTQGLLHGATLFDIYRPKPGDAGMQAGEKSLAIRLQLGSDQPLADDAIDAAVQTVLQSLHATLGARLRS